jgi:hypothetical protein
MLNKYLIRKEKGDENKVKILDKRKEEEKWDRNQMRNSGRSYPSPIDRIPD